MDTKFFRAGVGTVIYNSNKQIVWFERAVFPVGVWQFQQGGIDSGEEIEATLWRELREEVGLTEDNIAKVTEYGPWTIHLYPDEFLLSKKPEHRDRLGQAHKWFFIELKEGTVIDLSKATEAEFSAHEWTDFDTVISKTDPSKRPVYEELRDFFLREIC